MTFKILFDRDLCIGCGSCNRCDNWAMDDEERAYPKQTMLEELGENQDVADTCPVGAIKVIKI